MLSTGFQRSRINLFLPAIPCQKPKETQEKVFAKLISGATNTSFGNDHQFSGVKSHADFVKQVPIRDYEQLKTYFDRTANGEENVLWPGKTKWFSKSSGTTNAQSKLIPVTEESIQDCHYKGGKDLLSIYYHNNPSAKLFSGKHLILGGNTSVNKLNSGSYFVVKSNSVIKFNRL